MCAASDIRPQIPSRRAVAVSVDEERERAWEARTDSMSTGPTSARSEIGLAALATFVPIDELLSVPPETHAKH